jgi:arginine:pyruvate transaminase
MALTHPSPASPEQDSRAADGHGARLAALGPRVGPMLAAGAADAWTILDAARDRAASGRPILSLSIGQPVEPPPAEVAAALTAALQAGRTRYSPLLGEPALRQAIARLRGCDEAHVVVLPGAQHALLAVLSLILGDGDEVIAPDPHYATYAGTVATAGGRLVPVPMESPHFALDPGRLAHAIGPRTRAILVNSPCNPTGATIDAAGFRALAALCRAHGLWLVSDEVYGSLTYGKPHVSAWDHGPDDSTVVLDSLSKSHAMTGYRVGWALAPPRLVAALGEWSAAALFGVSQFVQDAAVAALETPESSLADYRAGFARRARLLVERLADVPSLSVSMPEGGMFALVDVRGVQGDDVAFAHALLEAEDVVVMPGSGFGPGGRGHVRISLTPADPDFEEALSRLARFATRVGR